MKRIEIPFGENKIVAEIYDMDCPEFPAEICIHLRDKEDVILQDICLVRPHYTMDSDANCIIEDDFAECLVWGDHNNEDYTRKYVIGVHKWEEE